MDSGGSVLGAEIGSESEGKDMISNLPDFVIAQILSILPRTKEAVRTCILSKRWKSLWTLITDLVFFDKEGEVSEEYSNIKKMEKQQFVNLVNHVLLRQQDSAINSLSLEISHDYDPSHFNKWISTALCRRVKKLSVILTRIYLNFPTCSLTQFKSLEELVLEMNGRAIRVSNPTSVCFSSLTILCLRRIRLIHYVDVSSNELLDLTLKFPVLREFQTLNCTWNGVNSVSLEVPQLQEALITSYPDDGITKDMINSYGIKFCASRLMNFTYDGYFLPRPRFLDLSAANIASACIKLRAKDDPYKEQEVTHHSCRLLKEFITKVESLEFTWERIIDFVPLQESLVNLPACRMLTRLKIGRVKGRLLLSLLEKTPMLETLIFEGVMKFVREPLNLPECIRSTLQVVEFSDEEIFRHDLNFLKFLVENAQVLQRMEFHHLDNDCSWLEDVKKKLLSFKKSSNVLMIEFFCEKKKDRISLI